MAQHHDRLRTMDQQDRYSSPWSVRSRLGVLLWQIVWLTLFRPTPKPLYRWRTFLLRLFGCRVTGVPYVAPSAIIRSPSKLVLEDRACLGPNSEVYNLATVTLRARATVSQQVYLCAGTHDFSDPAMPLVVGEIEIGEDAFLGARAFVMPGITIGAGAIAGACAVVTRDVAPGIVVAGNPAKVVGVRKINASAQERVS
jgi:putative colanic acid biosynthesis acetyltransferase WcaF